MHQRLFKQDDEANEKRPLHRCIGEFYRDRSSVKDFSYTRVPYHFEQAQMYKEMIDFLRGRTSRAVHAADRRAYLQVTLCLLSIVRSPIRSSIDQISFLSFFFVEP